jgi:hypothetical protein
LTSRLSRELWLLCTFLTLWPSKVKEGRMERGGGHKGPDRGKRMMDDGERAHGSLNKAKKVMEVETEIFLHCTLVWMFLLFFEPHISQLHNYFCLSLPKSFPVHAYYPSTQEAETEGSGVLG